ncbi:nitroreductase family protein [Stomatohabitans albus]|uniref:nitroreductase family protein n=1 Tax=Stomatohabitans albus TaxID=3110766 RepID=UPI00300D70B9
MACSPEELIATIAQRTSGQRFGERAPSDQELQALVPLLCQVANHMNLDCWRMHTVRGDARVDLGHAFNEADGVVSDQPSEKPLRAPLLIAIVFSPVPHDRVPRWEQMATATGAAHFLNLGLWATGWGSVWRTGPWISTEPVRTFHRLEPHEELLGWLYVGNLDQAPRERSGLPQPATALISPLSE